MFLFQLYSRIFGNILKFIPDWLLPTLARVIFLGVLFVPYWRSGLTKFGDGLAGLLVLSPGAYVQIFPQAMEAVGYNQSELSLVHHLIVFVGSYAEILIPLMIILGLATQLAALGMIGFIVVQSWVDIYGHGLSGDTVGTWFDNKADSIIFDQRAFWIFLLVFLVVKGAGRFSLDTMICNFLAKK